MEELITKTEFYVIEIDKVKNRGYITFTGFCKAASEIPNFLDDVKKATQGLKSGFTLLADLTKFKTPAKEVADLHMESQKTWIQLGLSKTAVLMPESALIKMATTRWSETSGMARKEFKGRNQAEAWLDEK